MGLGCQHSNGRTAAESSSDAEFCLSSTAVGLSAPEGVSAAVGSAAVVDADFSFACVVGAFAIKVDFDFDLV